MASSAIFLTAADARQNPIRETVVHDEARAIESAILDSVRNGYFQALVDGGTPMTSRNDVNIAVVSVDLTTDQLYVPAHPFKTGDQVTVSSNGALPSPLDGMDFYTIIYVDADHVRLAQSPAAARDPRPAAIDFQQGVVSIHIADEGSGYLSAPRITIDPNLAGRTATASAQLATWGNIDSISVLSAGKGFNDVPTVSITAQGVGAAAGTVTFKAVAASVVVGGSDYRIGDVLSVIGGAGTATTATVISVGPGGAVTGVMLGVPGAYTTLPDLSATATSVLPVGGSGCTLNLDMGVQGIAVASGGINYTAPPVVHITGTAKIQAVISAGRVVAFDVMSSGSGYTSTPIISLTSGSGAAAIAALQPTSLEGIDLLDGGSGYGSAPSVSIVPVGSGAMAGTVRMLMVNATLTNAGGGYAVGDILLIAGGAGTSNASIQVTQIGDLGQIISYVLITGGSYLSLPPMSNNSVIGGHGRSATFNLSAGVHEIDLGSGGSGYTAPPAIVFTSANGVGSGAAAHTKMVGDTVERIMVASAGSGYTAVPTVLITSGEGATAVATVAGGSVTSIQLIDRGRYYTCIPTVIISGDAIAAARLTSTGIDRIEMLDHGSDYSSKPVVQVISGPNQSGSIVAPSTVVNIGYSIAGITITDPGSGYDIAPQVSISPPAGASGTQATAEATLGVGMGTMVMSLYPESRDYWKVWKNQDPSSTLYSRPFTERMDSVINYFTSMGYSITRQTNPATGSTIQWTILW